MKEVPDPDGQSTIRSQESKAWSQLIAWLTPRTITSANTQNGFGGNEEDKKRVLYQVY